MAIISLFSIEQSLAQSGEEPNPMMETVFTEAEIGCDPQLRGQSQACYTQVLEKLQKNGYRVESDYRKIETSKDGFSRYVFKRGAKPKFVIVFLHGLWGDSSQFKTAFTNTGFLHDALPNQIFMTLPGHRRTAEMEAFKLKESSSQLSKRKFPKQHVTLVDWVKALDETMRIAADSAESVIVVGQSTGGLLGVIAANRYPQLVKGLVLIEPSLKVKSILDFGSCQFGSAINNFGPLKMLAQLVAGKLAANSDIRLGCEVQALANAQLNKFPVVSADEGAVNGADKKERLRSQVRRLAASIRQPVILLNNEHDAIVDEETNRLFFENLQSKKRYIGFNQTDIVNHGSITTSPSVVEVSVREMMANLGGALEKSTYLSLLSVLHYAKMGQTHLEFKDPATAKGKQRYFDFQVADGLATRICDVLKVDMACVDLRKTYEKIERDAREFHGKKSGASKSTDDHTPREEWLQRSKIFGEVDNLLDREVRVFKEKVLSGVSE